MKQEDEGGCRRMKQNPINLPSNREIVLKSLNGLKKRLQTDNWLLEAYSNKLQKMIDNGFIEPSNNKDT